MVFPWSCCRGGVQTGGFLVPFSNINQLIAYKHLLNTKQKRDILNALQAGSGVPLKLNKTQQGGFLGTLLASIAAPLAIEAVKKHLKWVYRNQDHRDHYQTMTRMEVISYINPCLFMEIGQKGLLVPGLKEKLRKKSKRKSQEEGFFWAKIHHSKTCPC